MRLYSKIALVSGFLCGLLAYTFHSFLWKGAFYHLTAFEFCLLYSIFWHESKPGIWKTVSAIFLCMAIDSMIDEIFFDPIRIAFNDYLGFGLVLFSAFIYERFFRRHRN